MREHLIKTSKTARYFTISNPGPNIRRLWIVCHGYGQSIQNFTSKFSDLNDGQTLIIAPEGLSRFYFGGFTGNVGASWMTKEDRLNEIEDYCNFIQAIYLSMISELPNLEQTTLLGFSQGCPTILRWAVKFKPEFQNLILWAGNLAHDIDYSSIIDWLNQKKMIAVIGDQDEFLTTENVERFKAFIRKQDLKIEIVPFEGKHLIDRKTLMEIDKKLRVDI